MDMIKENRETIYDLLNDIDQQMDQYEEETITKEELKGWKHAFHKRRFLEHASTGKRLRNAVATFAVLLLGFGIFHNQVSAGVDILTYHIQELLGNGSDLSDYSTKIDRTVTKNGITVSLGDVIVDDGCMYVAYTVKDTNTYTTEEDKLYAQVDANLLINGIPSLNGSRGGMAPGTSQGDEDIYMMELILNNKNPEKNKQYKLVFRNGNGRIGTISFVASGKELMKDVKRTKIDHTLTLENGLVLNMEEYVSNPVQQRIALNLISGVPENMNYDITLQGTDNLGRKMSFYLATWNGTTGKLVLHYDSDSLLDNSADMEGVTSFTVTPYAQEYPENSGKMDTEIKQIGETFTIKAE